MSDAVSRMMVENQGRFKKGVEKDVNVNVDVVPISDVIGALWTINGEESDVKLALEILNGIYSNTVLKTGKSQQPSPFREDTPSRSQELKEEKKIYNKTMAEAKLKVLELEKAIINYHLKKINLPH